MTQNKKRYFHDVIFHDVILSFRFYPIPKIENLETWKSFHLLQIFIVCITLSMGKVKTFH